MPQSWEQDLFAALLWAGPGSAVSHRSAAALWKLDGCDRKDVEFTLPRCRRPPAGLIAHRRPLQPGDVARLKGLAVTSASRTIFDLAGVVEEERLEVALDCALRRGLTSVGYLMRRFGTYAGRGRPGSAVMRRLLEARVDLGALDSALETRFLRLVRQERLPLPRAQYPVGGYRLDFAYPTLRLGIELEGYAFHSGKQMWDRDLRRRNDLLTLGWSVLHFSWDDITKRSDEVVDQLRTHLSPNLLR